jgi:hypothetical protein
MKEKILEIINFAVPEDTDIKATRLILLFNQHLLDKAKESNTISELIEKTFINI